VSYKINVLVLCVLSIDYITQIY